MTSTTEELAPASPPATRRPAVSTDRLLERLALTQRDPGEWKIIWEFPSKNTAGPRATRLRALTEGDGYEITTQNNGQLIARYVGKESKT